MAKKVWTAKMRADFAAKMAKYRGKGKRARSTAVRRTNPLPTKYVRRATSASKTVKHGFILIAHKGAGPRLHYDGAKFTNNGKPVLFASQSQAESTGRHLRSHFTILRGYTMATKAASGF